MKVLPINSFLNKYRVNTGALASMPCDERNGIFRIPYKNKMLITAISDGIEEDGSIITPWEHVSVDARYRKKNKVVHTMPTWEEMCYIKDLFWDKDEVVIQYHPAESDYVNLKKNCLHLWRYTGGAFPVPPKICV